jgi:hypothetical protein
MADPQPVPLQPAFGNNATWSFMVARHLANRRRPRSKRPPRPVAAIVLLLLILWMIAQML